MNISFSRHSKRRIQLYNIDETDVVETITTDMSGRRLKTGKHEVVNDTVSDKYGFPLKVVFVAENDNIVVITAYPLRKRHRS